MHSYNDYSRYYDNPMDGYQRAIERAMEASNDELLELEAEMNLKEQLAARTNDIIMVENGDGVYWQAPGSVLVGTHRHGIAAARIIVYLDSGETGGMTVTWCKYQNQLPEVIPHAFLLRAAEELGIEAHVCPPSETIVREVGLALSFGEVAGLQEAVHIRQHLLNDDLRRAMTANHQDEIDTARDRLADHMSLMEKLGIEPAPWGDNHQALMRAGRLEETQLDEPTLWG